MSIHVTQFRSCYLSLTPSTKVQAPDPSGLELPETLDADDATPAIFVDTVEALDAMIAHIVGDGKSAVEDSEDEGEDEDSGSGVEGRRGRGGCREIAIDLEHHSFR